MIETKLKTINLERDLIINGFSEIDEKLYRLLVMTLDLDKVESYVFKRLTIAGFLKEYTYWNDGKEIEMIRLKTEKEKFFLKIPNEKLRQILETYFLEIEYIDEVSENEDNKINITTP